MEFGGKFLGLFHLTSTVSLRTVVSLGLAEITCKFQNELVVMGQTKTGKTKECVNEQTQQFSSLAHQTWNFPLGPRGVQRLSQTFKGLLETAWEMEEEKSSEKLRRPTNMYEYVHTHGVSSSASSETTDIFHLGGFLKLFLIYCTTTLHQFYSGMVRTFFRRDPDEQHTQLDLDHHWAIDDTVNELSLNWMKRMPPLPLLRIEDTETLWLKFIPGVGFHPNMSNRWVDANSRSRPFFLKPRKRWETPTQIWSS